MHSSPSNLIPILTLLLIAIFPLTISLPLLPTSTTNITLYGDASFINTNTNNAITLTLNPPCPPSTPPSSSSSSIGRAFYLYPLRFLNPRTNSPLSFSCRFSFSIIPTTPLCSPGDGLAFLITSNLGSFNQEIGHLGLPQLAQNTQDSFMAVEFDTSLDPCVGDINGNHVGIDLNSYNSSVSADGYSSGVDFTSGQHITAWIEYRSSMKMIRVWVSYLPVRPENPILEAEIDLSNHLKEFMHVGFSASNGNGSAMHIVDRWRFRTFEFDFSPSMMFPKDAVEEGDCFICSPEEFELGKSRTRLSYSNVSIREIMTVIGSVAASVFLLFIAVLTVFWWVTNRKKRVLESRAGLMSKIESKKGPTRLSLWEIKSATGGFSKNKIIGEGASATVYKGTLPGGQVVAVKRFNHFSKVDHVLSPFTTEFATMARCLKHKNLVQLLGWCCEGHELVLVYEYLPNGSLDQILYRSDSVCVLTWEQRMNALMGVASCLTYLHEECDRQIIHRDVKACNIMLDADFTAKLGDFGLAEVYDRSCRSRKATIPAGTMGYLAPEYVYYGVPTVKSDVYSFGVVILEVGSGRRPVDDEGCLLVDWFWGLLEKGKLIEGVDGRLMGRYSRVDMERMLKVGLCCVHPDCEKRPTVKQAAMMLRGELKLPVLPVKKPSVKLRCVIPEGSQRILDSESESPWLTPKSHFGRE